MGDLVSVSKSWTFLVLFHLKFVVEYQVDFSSQRREALKFLFILRGF